MSSTSRSAVRALSAFAVLAVTAGAVAAGAGHEAAARPSSAAVHAQPAHAQPATAQQAAALPAARTAHAQPAAAKAGGARLHMVRNDGHRLAFYVVKGHGPVIVLDSGGGEDASYWKDLVGPLHAATGATVVTYDRAGMGRSDVVPGPWRVQGAVDDLAAGLRQLGVRGNVTLVSHSEAGEIATYFAQQHPRLLTGAVLVDASLPPLYTDEEIARIVAATGPALAEAEKDPTTPANRQLIATAQSYVPMHRAYHRATWPSTVPATVIVSEKTPFDGSPVDVQRWRDAAARFVDDGPRRTLVTAAGSSHDIPKDRPALVLRAIERMASAHR